MLTTTCPKCEKEVSVPAVAGPESRVKCPLCSEEYTLESVFADLPPMLELLDAPVAAASPMAAAVATDAADASVIELDAEADPEAKTQIASTADAGDSKPAFDFGGGESDAGEGPAAFSAGDASTTSSAGARSRPKKQSASPLKSILGVVAGGLVALPLAQMILWWLPGDWQRSQHDPIGLAPMLPNAVAFIAPAKLRTPEDELIDDTATTNPDTDDNNRNDDDRVVQPDIDEPDTSFGRSDLDNALRPNRNNGNQDDETDDTVDDIDIAPPGDDDEDDIGVDIDPIEPPAPVLLGYKEPPTYSPKELGEELKNMQDKGALLDDIANPEIDRDVRLSQASEFMDHAAKLAHVTTFTEDLKVGHREFLDEILLGAGNTRAKLNAVGSLGLQHFNDSEREGRGVLIAGKIESSEKHGQLFETKIIAHAKDQQPILVISREAISGNFGIGDRVMFLGEVVEKPNKKISGFNGPPEPVLWYGYSVALPQE